MILGITGTNGAGKGTVVDYLKTKGFSHYSASGFIAEEVERRGMPMNRTSMQDVGNDLRKTHYPSYIVETLYARAKEKGGDAIVESVREIAGAVFLKEHGAFLVAVDADRHVRYERAVLRGSSKDHVTYEQFCEQEDREMDKAEAFDMNIKNVMTMADARLENDGTLEELHMKIDGMLDALRKNHG